MTLRIHRLAEHTHNNYPSPNAALTRTQAAANLCPNGALRSLALPILESQRAPHTRHGYHP
jgi:hypothetical protein